MTNQHVKQNGKLEDNPSSGSPPRTTLLGTIFSPVFNFFSPANKNGKYKPLTVIWIFFKKIVWVFFFFFLETKSLFVAQAGVQ